MKKICYKVVRLVNNKQMVSASFRCSGQLNYHLGETTYPTFGKIFVFETLEQAKEWRKTLGFSYSPTTFLKGYGENPARMKAVSYWHYDAETFWKLKRRKKNWESFVMRYVRPVNGTLFVDSFTPTEEVES